MWVAGSLRCLFFCSSPWACWIRKVWKSQGSGECSPLDSACMKKSAPFLKWNTHAHTVFQTLRNRFHRMGCWVAVLECVFSTLRCFFLTTLQRLLLVPRRKHNCLLGPWRQRYPGEGDSDAAPLPAGDPSTQPVQRGRLQTPLAEEWGLPVCESGQDPEGYPGICFLKHAGKTEYLLPLGAC